LLCVKDAKTTRIGLNRIGYNCLCVNEKTQ
jgi:hypothetical protein